LCLAALADSRLASGGSSYNGPEVIIWNVADGTQLAKFEGHTRDVRCLAVLDGERLASGSDDHSVIIWNLADGTRLATLEGHTSDIYCLAALDGDRLASGSLDNSIIIWNLADGTQHKLEGHTGLASCLVAFDGNWLASGSYYGIRVRPVLHSAAYKFAECGSVFEFDEVARSCRDQHCLGDLFDAATMNTCDQEFWKETGLDEAKWDATTAITTQAHVFDAIAKVVNEETDPSSAMESLVKSVLGLMRDDDLLPDMKRRRVSNATIEKLAPSPLFRVVLDAKYATGPRQLLYVEFLSFLVVMLCFARVAAIDVLDFSAPWFLASKAVEKTIAVVVAFAVLAYFSAREVGQIKAVRAIELAQPEDHISMKSKEVLFDPDYYYETEGLTWYALAIPRYLVLFVVFLLFLPVWLVYFGLACAGKEYEWMKAFAGFDEVEGGIEVNKRSWFGKTIDEPITHDPLTFLGLPRAWRGDYWNWIDAATLGCAWAAFARAAMPGKHLSVDLASVTAILLWLRLMGFLKNLDQRLATFVLMMERIVCDIWVFLLFYFIWVLLFGSVFYMRLGTRHVDTFGFHDDGAPNAFESVRMTVFSLLLLSFTGDFEADNFPTHVDKALLIVYLLVTIIVQLNILIAIVSDSYDAARATGKGLYYRSHLELVTETAWAAKCFPKQLLPKIDEVWIKERLAAALMKHDDDDRGRIVDITRRTRAAVHADTRCIVAPIKRNIAALEARMVELQEMMQRLLAAQQAG
jgi:hypothetical protein